MLGTRSHTSLENFPRVSGNSNDTCSDRRARNHCEQENSLKHCFQGLLSHEGISLLARRNSLQKSLHHEQFRYHFEYIVSINKFERNKRYCIRLYRQKMEESNY